MARDVEKLIVTYAADLAVYEAAARKAWGVTQGVAGRIEQRFDRMNDRIDAVGTGIKRTLIASLTAITGGLTVREVLQYADSWRSAQNALRVAGLSGAGLADVLDQLFELAQKNAAPLEATVKLYGRASQAAANLGATQEDLLTATDAVGLALKISGQSATEASGALLQLSQIFQGNKVQAQEYNSLIDGLFPLLQAVASGSDRWAGSVAKLTRDVKASTVTSREFFQALLEGLPELQRRAKTATTTLGQAFTKIQNALTRYIGQTDEGLGATQRLIAGLEALADDFDNIADSAVRLASIIAGALVGRAIGGMLISLPLLVTGLRLLIGVAGAASGAASFLAANFRQATSAILAFNLAARAARLGTLLAVAGPLGFVIGGLATAFLDLGGAEEGVTAESLKLGNAFTILREALDKALAANDKMAKASGITRDALKRERDASVAIARAKIDEAGERLKNAEAAYEEQRAILAARAAEQEAGGLAGFAGLTSPAQREINARLENIRRFREELAKAKADLANLPEPAAIGAGGTGDPKKFESSLRSLRERIESLRLEAELTGRSRLEIEKRLTALQLEQELAREGLALTPERRAQIEQLSDAYAEAVVRVDQLAEAEANLRDTSADVLKGFVSDLRDGKSGTEALTGALDRLADRLLDLASDQVIDSLFGGLRNAGLFSRGAAGASAPAGSSFASIAGAIFHGGGRVGASGTATRHVPADVFANAPRLHDGLASNEMAAILQRGETVLTPPQMRALAGSRGGANVQVNVNVDARGASEISIERRVSQAVDASVPAIVDAAKSGVRAEAQARPGYLGNRTR